MNRYYHLAALLASIVDELADDVRLTDPVEALTVRRLEGAAGYIQRAAELVLECELSPELAAEVHALEALCVCGLERGEHMADPPFGTEDGLCVTGFRPAKRDTLPDLMTWSPPTAANDGAPS